MQPSEMGDGSVILRLTGLALAYGIFTITIEMSKRPIRKFVASTSLDCIAELWEMASSLWSAAAPGQDVRLRSTEQPPARASSSASRAGHRVHAHVASVPNATSKEQPLPVRVAVEDLCESCYHGWVRAEGLRALLSGAK